MMSTSTVYKPEISDLREMAIPVLRTEPVLCVMSARQAARVLSGVVQLMIGRWDVATMQRAAGELARCDLAWPELAALPVRAGTSREPIEMLATCCRSMVELAGVTNLRAALAFWGSESNPAVWTIVADR